MNNNGITIQNQRVGRRIVGDYVVCGNRAQLAALCNAIREVLEQQSPDSPPFWTEGTVFHVGIRQRVEYTEKDWCEG
jgi:hypothetical protein